MEERTIEFEGRAGRLLRVLGSDPIEGMRRVRDKCMGKMTLWLIQGMRLSVSWWKPAAGR